MFFLFHINLRSVKADIEEQFEKFMELLKSCISISHSKRTYFKCNYMPNFLKWSYQNKQKIEDNETMSLAEECSAIIQKKNYYPS